MKREHIAGVATVLVLGAVVLVLGIRNRSGPSAVSADPEKPSTVVFDLFQRAKAGDVRGYLACFTSDLRETVATSSREMGERAFREQISAMGEAVKGVLVQEDRADDREARLRVELVYADRSHNDVQTFTLRRRGGQWLITSMSRAKPLKMPIPYGTPAYPLELDADPSVEGQTGQDGAGEPLSDAD